MVNPRGNSKEWPPNSAMDRLKKHLIGSIKLVRSPIRTVVFLAILVFLVEFLIMKILHRTPWSGEPTEALIDSFALVLLLIPGLYFLLFRPMVASIETQGALDAALQESEEQFRGIYEQSPIAIEIYDFDGLLVEVNQACLDLFGVDHIAEVKGFKLFEDPNISEDAKKRLQKGEAVQYESVFDFDLVTKLGLYKTSKSGKCFIDALITPLRAENGNKSGGYLVQVQDITERKRAEELLHLQSVVALNMSEGIYLVRVTDLIIVYANPKFEEMFGYSPGEMTDKHVSIINALTDQDPVDRANEIKKGLQKDGFWKGDVRNIRKDGTEFWGQVSISTFNHPRYGDVYLSVQSDVTERKQAEEALRESEAKFRAISQQMPDALFLLDMDDPEIPVKIIDCNEMACKMHGYSRDELIGKSIEFIDTPETARMIPERKKILLKGKPLSFEAQHKRKDGSIFEVEVRIQLITISGKKVALAIDRDITERKRAEEALHRHNQELTTLLEVSKTLVSTLNMETVLQATTESIARYLGLETSAVYLLKGDELYLGATTPPLPPEMPDLFRIAPLSDHPHIEETISKKQTKFFLDIKSASLSAPEKAIIEARNIRSLLYIPLIAEKKVFGVLLVGSMGIPRDITDSEIESCSTLANIASLAIANTQLYKASQSNVADLEREVTERKQAEEALLESEERFRNLVETSQDLIWSCDAKGRFTYLNPAWEKLLGYELAEMQGHTFSEFKPPEIAERDLQTFKHILKGKTTFGYETVYISKSGQHRHLVFNARVLKDNKGQTLGTQGTAHDITERKRAEEALQTSRTELETRNRIANVFLMKPDETLYADLLDVILDVMASEFGFVSYIRENGDLVSPSMTRTIWDQCQIPDKNIIFPKENWTGLWGKSLLEQKPLRANEGLQVPQGHVPLRNALCVPIMHRGTLIGQIAVANKTSGYFDEDQRILVDIANHMAPILHARLKISRQTEERQQAEEALNESEKRFHRLYESAPIGIALVRENSLIEGNRSLLDMLGYTLRELKKQSLPSLFHPTDRLRLTSSYNEFVPGGRNRFTVELRLRTKRGRYKWVSLTGSILPMAGEGRPYHIFMMEDITTRTKVQRQLLESQSELRALSIHLQGLREEERKRIARELHDQLGATLTSLKMDISWLMEEGPEIQRSLAHEVIGKIDGTIQTVRDISSELRPSILDDWGLVAALEWLMQQYESRTKIACHLDLPDQELTLDKDQSTALFRIAQEGLTNVTRHAEASKVEIQVQKTSRSITLRLKDDGRGIERSQVKNRRSLGLLGMRERVQPWGGKFRVHGIKGRGTTLTVQMPVAKYKPEDSG